jgi:hypothetical protein
MVASWWTGRNYTALAVLALKPPYGDRRRREGKAGRDPDQFDHWLWYDEGELFGGDHVWHCGPFEKDVTAA